MVNTPALSMSKVLTIEDARESLRAHVAAKGTELRAKYGPYIGWADLPRLLLDREFVRYPCEIVFDVAELREGEFACPVPKGERPEAGFKMCVHPYFATQLEQVPAIVLYHLVAVNYGDFASASDAETFGSAALGIPVDTYYQILCEIADEISALPDSVSQ